MEYENEVVYEVIDETKKSKNICGLLSFIFVMVSIAINLLNCGLGTIGTLVSLVPIIGAIVSFFNVFLLPIMSGLSGLLTLASLILGIIGVCKKNSKKGLAIAGLIISALMIILSLVIAVIMIVAVGGVTATALLTGGIYGLASWLESMGY